jgi:hypothetical protein
MHCAFCCIISLRDENCTERHEEFFQSNLSLIADHGSRAVYGMNCLRSRGCRDRGLESHFGHRYLVFVLCVRFCVCIQLGAL